MPFTLLLLILSLVVIVPTAFVIKGQSRQKQLPYNNQGQPAIGHTSKGDQRTANRHSKVANTVANYRNNPKLPISFRQLLGNMHEQYQHLAMVNLTPEQRFTVEKLLGTRLPEILDDYLLLETDYAENTVIDSTQNLTSQDVTYGQLTSMLDFIQRMGDDSQDQVASNILANRSYLQSVYGTFYQDDTTADGGAAQAIKAPKNEDGSAALANRPSLYHQGEAYLQDCDEVLHIKPVANHDTVDQSVTIEPAAILDTLSLNTLSLTAHKNMLGADIITQLGQLVSVAERVLTYSDALLPSHVSLQAFDKIIAQAIPNLLRQAIIDRLVDRLKKAGQAAPLSSDKTLSSSQQEMIAQKISRCQQLLEACLISLERADKQQHSAHAANATNAIPADTLQLLQNTINSKHSQAQYLLDSGFFQAL